MDRRSEGFCMPSEKTYRIHINNHPHEIGPAPLPAAQVARMAGVPLDNVVIELETPAGLKEVALEDTVAAADGQRFIVTRQFTTGAPAGAMQTAADRTKN